MRVLAEFLRVHGAPIEEVLDTVYNTPTVYDEDFDQPSVITRTARRLDDDNGQRAHSALGNQSPQMYTEAAGMTLEPHFLRVFYAGECHSSLRSSPSPSSGSRSYAPKSLKKWLAQHPVAWYRIVTHPLVLGGGEKPFLSVEEGEPA